MKDKNPFFSIIIPTYNRAVFVKETILSLLKQNYPYYEIIVVDDGSTDDTEDVVKSIESEKIKYFKKENEERGAARNYGAEKAKGDYLNFFDSDDIALPNHLKEASNMINKNDYPEVFHLGYKIGAEIRALPKNLNKSLITGNHLSCNSVFIRADIFQQNKFDEDRTLAGSEDYLLWLKLASQYKIYSTPVATSIIVAHSSRSVVSMNKEKLIQRKILMLSKALNDPIIRNYYNHSLNKLKSNTYSYISLHLALAGHKKDSLNFLIKTLIIYPLFLTQKRFYAILKRLLF